MKNKIYLLIVFICLFFNCKAQEEQTPASDPTRFVKVIPPSPDASSLGKYGEVPIGKYNGTPEITIPIYSIKQNDIVLPVSLNYSSGGIKVEENASWVGLGWSLNAGGVITRTLVSLPDETQGGRTGYLNQPYDIETIASLSSNERKAIISAINKGELDLEPDIFSFNFLGRSGRFVVNKQTQKGMLLSQEDIIIKPPFFNGSGGWEIIDEKGFKYKFSEGERSIIEQESPKSVQSYTSTWYLKEIVSPTGNALTIKYQDYLNEYYTRTGVSAYTFKESTVDGIDCGVSDGEKENYVSNTIMGRRIESITFNQGTLKFIKGSTTREDMLNDYFLEAIELYDLKNRLVKRYVLYYSYFDSNEGLNSGSIANYYNANAKKRLRLDSLVEESQTRRKKPHSFEYYSGDLASVYSNSQDHWGYYNGAINESLVPLSSTSSNQIGTNRGVDISFSQIGTLKQINYPTGGNTRFEYESNTASITKSNYFKYFYPYGPTSSEYRQGYYASTNDQRRKDTLFVDPATVMIDKFSNFRITVHLATPDNCDGRTKDCVESLEVTLDCIDCSSPTDKLAVNLLAGQFVNGTHTRLIYLTPGRTYVLEKSGLPRTGVTSTVAGAKEVFPTDMDSKIDINVGGLRIKKITDNAIIGKNIVYEYNYNKKSTTSNLQSSGSLVSYPNYDQDNYEIINTNGSCIYSIRSSSSKLPLVTTGGGSVGYAFVEILKTDGDDKQLTMSTFSSPSKIADNISYIFPYTVRVSKEVSRGKLLSERYYKYVNDHFELIRLDSSEYSTSNIYYNPGLRIGCIRIDKRSSGLLTEYNLQNYKQTADWVYLKKKYKFEYNSSESNELSRTTNFFYESNSHHKPTREELINSKNEKQTTYYLYPSDYITGNVIVDQLKTNNIISEPLEAVSCIEKSSEMLVLKGIGIIYKDGIKGLKEKVLKLNLPSGYSTNNFKFSNKTIGMLPNSLDNNTLFNLDNMYNEQVQINHYDDKGNILEYVSDEKKHNCYLWDYRAEYPIAEIKNANILNIAYTSFESDGKGNWTFSGTPEDDSKAPTGTKVYNIANGAISKSDLTSTTEYIVSYWTKNASAFTITGTQGATVKLRSINNWNLFEHKVSGVTTISISGSGLMDELRLHPSDALMTTYTYEPLIGITNSTDVKNQITRYEYDDFQRLKFIRDAEHNILKTFNYNYYQPPVYLNVQKSQSFTKACGTGYTGSSVVYSVPEGKYTSTKSQSDADNKALNEIALNGQTNADNNGSCTLQTIQINAVNNSSNAVVRISFCDSNWQPLYSKVIIGGGADTFSLPYGTYNLIFKRENTQGSISVKYGGIHVGSAYVGAGIDPLTISNVQPKDILIE